MEFRNYRAEEDFDHVKLIWEEAGWIERSDEHAQLLADLLKCGSVLLSDLRNRPESMVHILPGKLLYQEKDLDFAGVGEVLTGYAARRRGMAAKLTAEAVARAADDGAAAAGLGMFEQGFYNRLGFGTGAYEHSISFDPAALTVRAACPDPLRLAADDYEQVHRSRLRRRRGHGACNLNDSAHTRAEMRFHRKNCVGFGFKDESGEISHHFWGEKKGRNGPLRIQWAAYRNTDQLLELLSLFKNLSDQIYCVSMREPPEIQMQDLLKFPFRDRNRSRSSSFENKMTTEAYWQIRVLDPAACIGAYSGEHREIEFNLRIADPIEGYLRDRRGWRGIGGDYSVRLGRQSEMSSGFKPGLPLIEAEAGAFSRMWLGVRRPSSLAVTDRISGDPELLTVLDRILCLPQPHFDWDF